MMVLSCPPMFKFLYALPDGATVKYEISNHGFSDFFAHVLLWFFMNNVYTSPHFALFQ